MKVFVTGASGFIGTAVVSELLSHGHEIVGLARSDKSAEKIESLGANAKAIRGELQELDILKKGASEADAVIHLGFVHDFSSYDESCKIDRKAAVAMLDSLEGTNKLFVYTNGTFALPSGGGKIASEKDGRDTSIHNLRAINEEIALSYNKTGVKVAAVRLAATVHAKGDRAFLPILIDLAKSTGKSAFIGKGKNMWPAVSRLDAARLYRLVLEKGTAGGVYHGAAEQGVEFKKIAEAIGEILDVPTISIPVEKAEEHFGSLASFVAKNGPVSSSITRQELGWEPRDPGLLEDILKNYRT